MNINELNSAILSGNKIKHPRFVDVSFIPTGYAIKPDCVFIRGYWHNELYNLLCTDKMDLLEVKDLDVWQIIKA